MEKEEVNATKDIVEVKDNKGLKKTLIGILEVLFVVSVAGVVFWFIFATTDQNDLKEENEVKYDSKYLNYRISGNSVNDFDLSFLQIHNTKENIIYSPLSIKYALLMLNDGANGDTKTQISNLVGDYSPKKYVNSENKSFANALFVKNSFKGSIKKTYTDTLLNKYNASVVYDSFNSPDVINAWVKSNTFDLISNIFDDVNEFDFILANALAIDMEWENKIQSVNDFYVSEFAHRDFYNNVGSLGTTGYSNLKFDRDSYEAKAVQIAATANRYDLVKTVGEDSIRATVGPEYEKWLEENKDLFGEPQPDVETYLNTYVKEIGEGYNEVSKSTDFMFYVDDNVKFFAKDLKEYDGSTLQYVGIMPVSKTLDTYIQDVKASDVEKLIDGLKTIELNNFKDGVITKVFGYIPMFNFDYEINLKNDLKVFGVTDVFDSEKVDLTNISSKGAVINQATHKANIDFSNDGIKASAVTAFGGAGAAGGEFEYLYEVPVEEIDLTFDKPYMFLIRDKESGEVWFTGSVYKPTKIKLEDLGGA